MYFPLAGFEFVTVARVSEINVSMTKYNITIIISDLVTQLSSGNLLL